MYLLNLRLLLLQINYNDRSVFIFFIVLLLSVISCDDQKIETDDDQRGSITALKPPFGKSDQSCGPFPNYYFEYLDDTKCQKALPSNRDRDFTCPIKTSQDLIDQSNYKSVHTTSNVMVDAHALLPFVPKGASITMILIRRVDGIPHYRYLSNGTHGNIVETWSSSKFLGVVNASENLRFYSKGKLGLDATVDDIPMGDLVTVVHNYDEQRYTSNGLMTWFHDVGGRGYANLLIHEYWLDRPKDEVFGANYGARAAELGFTFKIDNDVTRLQPDQGWIRNNELSTFTLAEALKRIVMHREDPQTQLDHSTWDDIKVLLYGAQNSIWYDSNTPQGMESDVSIYLQHAVDIKQVDLNTQGQWRIFSKLGLGASRGGEFVHTDYACLPIFDSKGNAIVDQGVELVLSMHLPANGNYGEGDKIFAQTYRNLIQAVLNGDIR